MSKYLIKEGNRGMFKVDTDDIDVIDYSSSGINWIYQADDDGAVTYKNGETSYTVDVKKGDLVIQFYQHEGRNHPIIVIDDDNWKENIEGVKQAKLKAAEHATDAEDFANAYCGDCDKAC